MPRIKDFIKKNYVLCTVFAVILVVCIASLIIIHLINKFKPFVDIKNENGAYYQVIGSKNYSFDATLRKEDSVIKEISPKDYKLVSISPIYYEDASKLILTDDSAIVFYLQGFKDYKLNKYTELSYESENAVIILKGKRVVSGDSFIYDKNGNYIVTDNVTLKYNGKTIKLSPLSFVNASASGLTYYDYDSKTIVDEKDDIKSAFLIYDTFNIDLLKNVTIKNGKVNILKSNVGSLTEYKED